MSITYGIDTNWAAKTVQGRNHIANLGIIQSGLVFNIDAGSSLSYPGTGNTLFDLKENQNLILTNGPYYSSTDYYGGIIFDGIDDYVFASNLPLNSPLSLTTNFTIEQVFKPTAYQTSSYYSLTNMLFSKGTASTYNYATQVSNNTTVSFIKRNNSEGLLFHNFTVPGMQNKVSVITFVVQNGDNTSIDTVTCYYNGQFISTINIDGGLMAAYADDPIYLGGFTQYTYFIGSYYSCRIYNRTLSLSEIQRNFNTIRFRYGI